ncbi:MAG TPA: peptidoglycan-binding domain-containing protein [Gaiellaceae bacterium]|nr:peptidoglycan-binding domain-containing protein [Gaiellaceae bacterium]
MEGREERDPGYDDWFDEPEPPSETQSGANRGVYEPVEEVWVLPEDEPPHERGPRGEFTLGNRTVTTTQAAIVAGSVLALVLAILAATGAFSSNKAAVPPVTTPRPPATVTVTSPATTATKPTTQAPQQTLSPGDTGEQVKVLQRALTALGFSPGKPDGDYGPATKVEVEKFQLSKGLAEDGVVGQQTLAALQQALSG